MSIDTPPFDPSDYSYVIGIGKKAEKLGRKKLLDY
jgi:hypothetical protein